MEAFATEEEVIAFYNANDLHPGMTYRMSKELYESLVDDAFEMNKCFGLFFKESLQAVGPNTYEMNFESCQELYNCYCSFTAGFVGNKS